MPLRGRKYTWCNEQRNPILARLDMVFYNDTWEDTFLISGISALSSNISHHCPLLLSCSEARPRAFRFRFENFWCKLCGFMDVVGNAWDREVLCCDPVFVFNTKLGRTAKGLRSWGQRRQSKLALQFHIANEVILRLYEARERHPLSKQERGLRALLKGKCLPFPSLERVRLRQPSSQGPEGG